MRSPYKSPSKNFQNRRLVTMTNENSRKSPRIKEKQSIYIHFSYCFGKGFYLMHLSYLKEEFALILILKKKIAFLKYLYAIYDYSLAEVLGGYPLFSNLMPVSVLLGTL